MANRRFTKTPNPNQLALSQAHSHNLSKWLSEKSRASPTWAVVPTTRLECPSLPLAPSLDKFVLCLFLTSDATDVPRARSTMIPTPAFVAPADVMASTRTREHQPPSLGCRVSF
ncbi:hypothetical protein CGRA01v4_01374 [Colletotrichum graminicola]|nr:hypothetical protein CGRA01v4_01374 [Colletotrichum graminicola]